MSGTDYAKEGIVHIENLVKRYASLVALDHLNLDIREGEIFGLLGPNGSGKTTAINCILALLKYDKGSIRIFGKEMEPDNYEAKRQIGIVQQNVAVFDEFTVYENIDYFCGLYINDRKKRKQLVEEAIAFVGLEDYRKIRPKKLSGGLLRRLNIACGIAHKPRLIILDEPTVAVDSGRNPAAEQTGLHYYLYFSLYGRGGADLYKNSNYGSWKKYCIRNKGTADRNDKNRGKGDGRGCCTERRAACTDSGTGPCI